MDMDKKRLRLKKEAGIRSLKNVAARNLKALRNAKNKVFLTLDDYRQKFRKKKNDLAVKIENADTDKYKRWILLAFVIALLMALTAILTRGNVTWYGNVGLLELITVQCIFIGVTGFSLSFFLPQQKAKDIVQRTAKTKLTGREKEQYALIYVVFVLFFYCVILAGQPGTRANGSVFQSFYSAAFLLLKVFGGFYANYKTVFAKFLFWSSIICMVLVFLQEKSRNLLKVLLPPVVLLVIQVVSVFICGPIALFEFLLAPFIFGGVLIGYYLKTDIFYREREKKRRSSKGQKVLFCFLVISLIVVYVLGKSGGLANVFNIYIGDMSSDYHNALDAKSEYELNRFITTAVLSVALTFLIKLGSLKIFRGKDENTHLQPINIALLTTLFTLLCMAFFETGTMDLAHKYFETINSFSETAKLILKIVAFIPIVIIVILGPLLEKIESAIVQILVLMAVLIILVCAPFSQKILFYSVMFLLFTLTSLSSGYIIYLVGFTAFAYLYNALSPLCRITIGLFIVNLITAAISDQYTEVSARYIDHFKESTGRIVEKIREHLESI